MVAKYLLVLSFLAAAIAEPIPQDSAATTSAPGAATTAPGAAVTSFDTALPSSVSFLEACASSEEAIYEGVPTLPASVELALATIVPTSLLTETGCAQQTAIEGYYASLPASIVSVLSSYSAAIESWYDAHSAQLDALASSCAVSGTVTYTPSSVSVAICTGGAAQPGSTATGATGGKTTSAGSSAGKGTSATGAATAGSTGAGTGGSSTASGSGSVASTSKSAGGAAPTGAITFGAAGVVGLLGLLVAL